MKLTIGMIVKNEEKWLEKCLTAIKPILDNVDSELIITDTGSTDRTVEIAKKFTDKVLHFEWCNDFAVARNTGIDAAQGEWFMFIDADEIFENCDGIIDFFNSGEYKKYNAGYFAIRNYFKVGEGKGYNDFWAPRLVKIDSKTRFVNPVHEALRPFDAPYKNIKDVVGHYGYFYESEEDLIRKFNRNSQILLKRLSEETNPSPSLYVQLYESFLSVKKNDTAIYYLEQGFELCRKKKDPSLIVMYFHKAAFYQMAEDYTKVLEVCYEYFSKKASLESDVSYTDGEIAGIRSEALYRLGRYDDAILSYKRFFELYKDIENGKICTPDMYLIRGYMCIDISILPLLDEFMDCCIRMKKYSLAQEYMTEYPVYKYCMEVRKIVEFVSNEIVVLDHFDYCNLSRYYNNLDERGKELMEKMLLIRLYNTHAGKSVLNGTENIAHNNSRFLDDVNTYRLFYDGHADLKVLENAAKLMVTSCIHSKEICNVKDNELLKIDTEEIMSQLSGLYHQYINLRDNNIEDCTDIIKALQTIEMLPELRELRRYKEIVSTIKKAISLYQPLAPLLSEYSNIIMEEYGAENKYDPQSEMQRLSAAIKRNIKGYIAAGNIAVASKTLNDYAAINPGDKEISELRKLIEQ